MAVTFKSTVKLDHINISRYTKELDFAMRRVVKIAARQFLLHTTLRIPVDTGFLRGAFMNLEYLLGSATGRFVKAKGKTKTITRMNEKGQIVQETVEPKRFQPDKRANQVNRMNKINSLQRKIRILKRRAMKEQENNAIQDRNAKEARQRFREELAQREQELNALKEAYRQGKISTKDYLKAYNNKRYKILKLSATKRAFYIEGLIEARYNRAIRSSKRVQAYAKAVGKMKNQIIKEQLRLGKILGITGRSKIKFERNKRTGFQQLTREGEAAYKEYKKKLRQHQQKGINYYYRPTRTNVNPSSGIAAFNRPKYYHFAGLKILKNPMEGRVFGTPLNQIFSYKMTKAGTELTGTLATTRGRTVTDKKTGKTYNREDSTREILTPVITFNYKVLIRYLDVNDVKRGWMSWQAGIQAYNDTILRLMSTMPRVEDYTYQTKSQHGYEKSETQASTNFQNQHRDRT